MAGSRSVRAIVVAVVVMVAVAAFSPCNAAVIYVDNRVGNDHYLGYSATPGGDITGPLQSISRALWLARTGDTIEINNTGIPYYESLGLFGPQNSGTPSRPFTIRGNGAVIDGSSPVPPDSWISQGQGLWKVTPYRKGYYGLTLNNQPLPEVPVPATTHVRPNVPVGSWCAWRGSIYYHANGLADPQTLNIRLAHLGMGITLYRVENVVIRDLTFQHFRVDGVNAPDLSYGILLEGVKSIDNGRSGLFVGGTSDVTAIHCDFNGNRETQVLLRALGRLRLEESNMSAPPVEID